MRITLTGATGHSGRWFIERLKKEKFDGELVCLVREGNDVTHIESSGLNYRIVRGTVEDAEKLDLSLECFLQALFAKSCKLKMQNVALCIFHSFAGPDFGLIHSKIRNCRLTGS